MAAPVDKHKLPDVDGVTCHSWNADKSKVALCPNTEEIHIYSKCVGEDVTKWELEHVLSEHDLVVSGIDWSPVTNKIVSCSHDRNAFVWTYDDKSKKWKPAIVILRINRAATDVKWSPDGKKFAAASGSKQVPVCHYEAANDWWISKMIKSHKSTVNSVSWHPNSQLIATGCADNKARVFSAFIDEVDGSFNSGPLPASVESLFGEKLCEFNEANGWVECISWSPSGDKLAFVGHDSSISIVEWTGGAHTVNTVKHSQLPYTCCAWLEEDVIVVAGHDYNPAIYSSDGKSWNFNGYCDVKKTGPASPAKDGAGFRNKMTMFENKVSKGGGGADAGFQTKHQGLIMSVARLDANRFSSAGLDGRFIIWNVKDVPDMKLK